MTIITRTVHNASLVNIDLFIPGYDTIKPPIVIAPSVTLDLFTVLTTDELETIQNQIASFVAAGNLTVIATVDTTTFNPVGGVATTPAGSNTQIQFNNSGSFGASSSLIWDGTTLIDGGFLSVGPIGTNPPPFGPENYTAYIGGVGGFACQPVSPNVTSFIDFYDITGNNFAEVGYAGLGNAVYIQPNSSGIVALAASNFFATLVATDTNQIVIGKPASNLNTPFSPAPDASALVTINSTTQGFLPPRMTTTQKDAIVTPVEGLMVYDTTAHAPYFWNGSSWIAF